MIKKKGQRSRNARADRKMRITAVVQALAVYFVLGIILVKSWGAREDLAGFALPAQAAFGAVGQIAESSGLPDRIQRDASYLKQQAELMIQKAEELKKMKEIQAYMESIPAMAAGESIETASLSKDQLSQLFYQEEILEEGSVYARINGLSYRENPNIALSQLRYLRVLYLGFDGQTHVGEMIVNAEIAEDVLEIFQELYKAEYPIERMQLVDDYQADDNASMAANNSSAFNYRYIASSTKLSNHSWGKAVDINPLYNPYIYTAGGRLHVDPADSEAYVDRSGDCPYMIDHEDLCCRLFLEHGFTWGGDWNGRKDYQHFEKE